VGLGGGCDAGVEGADRLVERVDVGEQTGDEHAVVGELEAVGERFLQPRDLRPQPAFRELGQLGRVADTGKQRFEHRPCRGRVRRGDARELDPRVLEHLLQPLDRARALLRLGDAEPGQVTQPADLRWRHKARPHQPMLEQLAAPGRVDHVALPAGDVVQVLRVQQPAREAPLEHGEGRLPVDAGRLHPDQRHVEALQPVGERLELTDRGAKAPGLLLAPTPALSRAR
jgi:hypothetical protein